MQEALIMNCEENFEFQENKTVQWRSALRGAMDMMLYRMVRYKPYLELLEDKLILRKIAYRREGPFQTGAMPGTCEIVTPTNRSAKRGYFWDLRKVETDKS